MVLSSVDMHTIYHLLISAQADAGPRSVYPANLPGQIAHRNAAIYTTSLHNCYLHCSEEDSIRWLDEYEADSTFSYCLCTGNAALIHVSYGSDMCHGTMGMARRFNVPHAKLDPLEADVAFTAWHSEAAIGLQALLGEQRYQRVEGAYLRRERGSSEFMLQSEPLWIEISNTAVDQYASGAYGGMVTMVHAPDLSTAPA